VREKNLAGGETQYEYDSLSQLTKVIQFQNEQPLTTTFVYDEAGNRISQTDANGNTTTWTYDKLGRVLSRTLPLGMTSSFVYDRKTGHLISQKDFDNQTTTYQYDPKNGRLLSITYTDQTVSFTYDTVGNRKTMADSQGTTTYSYDNLYRLSKEVKPNQAVLAYEYDKIGNLSLFKFTLPDGTVIAQVQYQYDKLNRLEKVIAPDGETTYSYDKLGNRDQVTYANGTYTRYNYDKLSQLTALETRKADNSLLASYQYTLLPNGHRTQVVEHTGRVVAYSYDDLYRLKEEKVTDTGGESVFSYQYDAVGNRVYSIEDGVHTKYSYDNNDRLLKQAGVSYQYDKNGNTTRIEREGHIIGLSYDSANRLVSVTTEANGQVTSTVTYAYDADGNRIKTDASGQVTQYVVDNNLAMPQVVAELDQDNQVNVAYLYGDDLISQYRGNDVHYYHYDGLGSTRLLTDSNGARTDSYDYEAFGELLQQTGETENNYLYTGEQVDPNTGGYYLRARYYNPESGRFLSMDSFDGVAQDPITLHKYLYANGDPVNMIDPTGYFSIGSLSVGNAISGILNTMHRLSKVMDILNFATDPTGALTNRALGSVFLLGRLGKNAGKLMRPFNKMCRQKKNSFTAGTLVRTERGLVPIEEIQIGDHVLSYNEKTTQTQYNEVVNLIQGEQDYTIVTLTLENGKTLEATAEHPFYIQGKGWNPASSLKVGEALQLHNGTTVVIEAILTGVRPEKVYNLTVANAHTYFVGEDGVLVHNEDEWCDPVKAKKTAIEKLRRLLNRSEKDPAERAKKITGRKKNFTISVAYHLLTGGSAFGISRLGSSGPVHDQLDRYANQPSKSLNRVGSKTLEAHPLGNCAEFNAANKLLWKTEKSDGSDLAKLPYIRWTKAYRIKSVELKRQSPCKYCQILIGDATQRRLQECNL